MEELGRVNLALGHLAGRTIYASQLLLRFGTPDQQAAHIPRLRAGEIVFSIGLSEPNAGSDAAALETRAVSDGSGGFVINGTKVFTSSMDYAELVIVAARTDPTAAKRHDGITTFLVDPKSAGISTTRLHTIGDWPIGTCQVYYADVRVPPDSILGELDGGWSVLTSHLARERLVMAARAVGGTRAVLDLAADYARQRVQFGRPLADFQVIQHKLANIRIELQVARSALYDVARQAAAGVECANEAAAVKVFTSEMYVRASSEALQVFGGYGYTMETAVQRHWRDSRLYTIGGGSSEILRNLLARDLLRGPRPAQQITTA
jgi:alkylation response protein AidB-like acyl-CoA dehydrogenase